MPDDIDALKAALIGLRAEVARVEAEAARARAQLVEHQAVIPALKAQIEKYNRDRHGLVQSASRVLDQLELQLDEAESSATEDELAAEMAAAKVKARGGIQPPAACAMIARSGDRRRPPWCSNTHVIVSVSIRSDFWRDGSASRRPMPMEVIMRSIVPIEVLGQSVGALCWSHGRRKVFELADIAEAARRRARAKTAITSPIALEAVKCIDAPFDIDRCINSRILAERLAIRQELSPRPVSPSWRTGRASNVRSCRATTRWPKRSITC